MNKTLAGGLAALFLFATLLVYLPWPGPWLSPVFFLAGGAILLARLRQTRSVAPTSESPAVSPEVLHSVEIQEVFPASTIEQIQKLRAVVELAEGLKNLVVRDTEAAAVQLTGALFSLVQNSKEVSAHIEQSLTFITDGDVGLGKTLANLEEQVQVFAALSSHFSEVKTNLASDIQALTKAVGSINQFSGTLSDLADQTNVLAINASIEAARVGVHGRGFAVIAGHVQALAKHSKDISDKMAQTIREVVSNVEQSFVRQQDRIGDSEALIRGAEQTLRTWASQVGPQLSEVEALVGESRRRAEVVTGQLGEVTVSLQFQDRTRQILDHLTEVIQDATDDLLSAVPQDLSPPSPQVRTQAFEQASKRFTVREEWAIGSAQASAPIPSKTVELF